MSFSSIMLWKWASSGNLQDRSTAKRDQREKSGEGQDEEEAEGLPVPTMHRPGESFLGRTAMQHHNAHTCTFQTPCKGLRMPPKRRSKTLGVKVGDIVLGLGPRCKIYQALCACIGVAGVQLQAVLLKQRVEHSVLEEHQILSPVRRSFLDEGLKLVIAGADVDRA